MGITLILIGIGCMIAAIVGGGVKLHQLEVGTIKCVRRQILLFVFGAAVAAAGAAVNANAREGDPTGNLPGPVDPGPVDPGPIENAAAPITNSTVPPRPVQEPASDKPPVPAVPAGSAVNIAGRWMFDGTMFTFTQAGQNLFVTAPEGAGMSGPGMLVGREARWQLTGDEIGVIECSGRVAQDQRVIAGGCVGQGGETIPFRLDRL